MGRTNCWSNWDLNAQLLQSIILLIHRSNCQYPTHVLNQVVLIIDIFFLTIDHLLLAELTASWLKWLLSADIPRGAKCPDDSRILKPARWGSQLTLVPKWTVQNTIWNTIFVFTVSLSLFKYSNNTLGTFCDTEEELQSLRLFTMNAKCYQANHLGLGRKVCFHIVKITRLWHNLPQPRQVIRGNVRPSLWKLKEPPCLYVALNWI